MTDLAAIVARDAEWVEQADGRLAYSWVNVRSGERRIAPYATDPDGPADRRALLALLRETRLVLAEARVVLGGYRVDGRGWPELVADTFPRIDAALAALDEPTDLYRCSVCGSDDRVEHNDEMHAQEARA